MAQSAPRHARNSPAPPPRRAGRAVMWGVACTAAVWLASFAICLLIQRVGGSGFSAIVAASLVTASFLAHAAILLDEDDVGELLGAAS